MALTIDEEHPFSTSKTFAVEIAFDAVGGLALLTFACSSHRVGGFASYAVSAITVHTERVEASSAEAIVEVVACQAFRTFTVALAYFAVYFRT